MNLQNANYMWLGYHYLSSY